MIDSSFWVIHTTFWR